MRLGALIIPAAAAMLWSASGVAQQQGAQGEIHVASTPPDAVVRLEGKIKGNTPLTIDGLAPGTYLLRLDKRGYREHLLTVTMAPEQKLAFDVAMEPVTGLVLIHSNPSDATIEIDGIDRGKTPLLITDLPLGEYRVRVFKNAYLPKELQLKLKDRTPIRIASDLTADSAALTIRSVPPGAYVNVNGIPHGTTPCTASSVPKGESTITVSMDGYAPRNQTIRLSAGQEKEISVSLLPLPSSLTVESVPPEARIYVDNQFKGKAPLALEQLDPGIYRIRAELPGHEPLARTVELKRASDVVEEFRMEANVGALQITTQPAGVQLFIDGKKAGTTAAKPNQTDRVSEPFAVELIEPGEHLLKLAKPGYHTQSVSLNIERDKTTIQHFHLKRMFIPNCEVRTDTDVFQGVLLQVDPRGNVKLEVRPGIVKTIPANKIVSRRPLRSE